MNRMLSILVGLAALAASTADARELRVAPGAPPAHPSNSHLYQKLVEYLPEVSDGQLTGQLLGPEVVSLGQMKDALQSQLVEVGNILPLYFPADLPNMALAGELALSGREPHAMAAAMTEYMVTCDTCQQELKKFGVVYLGSGSSDVYAILTKKPVKTAEDLKGLRLRSGGAPFSRFAEHFGAVPANIPVGDTFESMSQGVIDGSMASVGDLLSFRLVELVKDVTLVPLGTYHATSDFTVSGTTWESLSPEERKQLATAANKANVDFTQRWGYEMAAEATKAAKDAGITFVDPDPAFVKAVQDFAEADKETAAKVAQERFGFTDAGDRVARFSALVDKWNGIFQEVKGDPAELTKRLDSEIWSKVDFSTYGT
ncbi:C4-dicarboxylate TRAP transporter substrate-binding protein [Rhizobium halophytocola]|uniref:TRAP-type C4-dicarboxylate transport system substrate-binding protein n=1 Tax=Rhizobium halophytocola TaxID=735519 RepID=A0ABS4E1F3_9HYPH|nr:C4-dicarboxylate TRAP transporter substrate-binding protein [Rhizobium halophytocola]MBP1851769.1 TRAP-type C4-dicarboxylate transport system substrate-binding protein [Rhizobium halophytocola]